MDMPLQGNTVHDILIVEFVNDESLCAKIDKTEYIPELSWLLEILHLRILKKLTCKRNIPVAKILIRDCSHAIKTTALKSALLVQADKREWKYCLHVLNERLSMLDWENPCDGTNTNLFLDSLLMVAVILDVSVGFEEEMFKHLNMFNMKMFLLKLCTVNISKDILINKSSLFFKYFEVISLEDPEFVDETVQYFIEQENLDYLCLLFEKKLERIFKGRKYLHEEHFWNFIKTHIRSNNSVKKKQGEYILWIIIEHFRTHTVVVPRALEMNAFQDWDFFFILLEMSREKQLHLVQPTLKLLPLISNLNITWQRCLYHEFLKHSQITVVYAVVKHMLRLEFSCERIYREILNDILVALNKYDYSCLSKEIYSDLKVFCNKLNEDCYVMFLEEFLSVEWNPVAAWSVLTSISTILSKYPQHLIIKMFTCLRRLPHIYIKYSCIIFFFQNILKNSTPNLEIAILIGKLCFSTNQSIDEQVFHQLMRDNMEYLGGVIEKLENIILESAKDKKPDCLVVSLELMGVMNKKIQSDIEIPYSNIGDILLFYFPNLLKPSDLGIYLAKRSQNVDCNNQYFFRLLEMILDNNTLAIARNQCLELLNMPEYEKNETFLKSFMLDRIDELDSEYIKQTETCSKFPQYKIAELWIKKFRKSSEGKQNDENQEPLFQKFFQLLDSDDEQALKIIIHNLDLVIKCKITDKYKFIHILDMCLRRLCSLQNNLMRKYSSVFLQSIFQFNLFSVQQFSEHWEKWYLEFFESHFMEHHDLLKIMLEGCRNIISLEAPYANVVTPLILKALTLGTVIQKNQRVEYGICQEIVGALNISVSESPNIIVSEVKMIAMECLYLLAKNKFNKNVPSADDLMEMLLALYMENYKKRYFPDSKIHLDKLRIVQAMLIIVHFTDRSKEKLLQFILKSFSEESHQPSVKILLQWLLILVGLRTPNYLERMVENIRNSNHSQPSCVIALIPVVFHLVTTSEDEAQWFEVTDILSPWTMGANFKLRVYAQVTLINMLWRAKNKSLPEYIRKYSFMEKSITSVLEATGNSVSDTLKNDITFIENFNPNLHYSVENIFVALPRLLDVPPSEWENIMNHNFSKKFELQIEAEHKIPCTFTKKNMNDDEDVIYTANVQKKIIPWKEKIENKSLSNLICVASLVEKSSNIGGLSRTCEIFNVQQLVLHNIKIKDDKEFKNLSMSSENWVDFMEVKKEELSNFLMKLKESGYSIVGLEQTSESVKLNQFKFEKKCVIVLGNEKEGIPAPLLPLLDICVEIPQFGQTRSLNVHVAGATFIWEYVKQHML